MAALTLTEELDALDKLVTDSVKPDLQSTFRPKIFRIRERVEELEATNARLVKQNLVAENIAQELRVQNEDLQTRNPPSLHREDVDLCAAIRAIVGTIDTNKKGICLPSNERTLVENLQVMVDDIKIRAKRRLGVTDTEVP